MLSCHTAADVNWRVEGETRRIVCHECGWHARIMVLYIHKPVVTSVMRILFLSWHFSIPRLLASKMLQPEITEAYRLQARDVIHPDNSQETSSAFFSSDNICRMWVELRADDSAARASATVALVNHHHISVHVISLSRLGAEINNLCHCLSNVRRVWIFKLRITKQSQSLSFAAYFNDVYVKMSILCNMWPTEIFGHNVAWNFVSLTFDIYSSVTLSKVWKAINDEKQNYLNFIVRCWMDAGDTV